MGRQEDLIEANSRGLLTGQIKADFDSAVERGLIKLPNESSEAPAQSQSKEQDKGFFKTVGEDISKRYGKVADYASRQDHPVLDLPATGAVAASQAIGAAGDVAGEITMRALDAVTPEFIQEEFKEKASKLMATEEGQWALDKMKIVGSKLSELAEKYPDEAIALEGIATALGGSTMQKGVTALGKGTVSAGKRAIKTPVGEKIVEGIKTASDIIPEPSTRVVQAHAKKLNLDTVEKVKDAINVTLKPSVVKKRTPAQTKTYNDRALTAVEAIVKNKENLSLPDKSGALVSKLPSSVVDMQNALDQTKKTVFQEMDRIVKTTGDLDNITGDNIVKNLQKSIVDNKALQQEGKAAVAYAKERIEDYKGWKGTAAETQEVIQVLNSSLEAFYKNPTKQTYAEAYVDSLVANNLRKDLDTMIKNTTGEQYSKQKKLYSALKTIEDDVARVANKERNKLTGEIMPTFTDVIAGHQLVSGLASMNVGAIAGGSALEGISLYRKLKRNPNRRIEKMFKAVDKNLNMQTKVKGREIQTLIGGVTP